MEVQATFCHNKAADASDWSPIACPHTPLDWLSLRLEELKATAAWLDSDWLLREKYLLMPLFDVNSIHELELLAADKKRLSWLMSQKHPHLEKVLTRLGSELFFAELAAFGSSSACERSRSRPHLIGDDTKVAKTHSCCLEYLTQRFGPSEGLKLPAYH